MISISTALPSNHARSPSPSKIYFSLEVLIPAPLILFFHKSKYVVYLKTWHILREVLSYSNYLKYLSPISRVSSLKIPCRKETLSRPRQVRLYTKPSLLKAYSDTFLISSTLFPCQALIPFLAFRSCSVRPQDL